MKDLICQIRESHDLNKLNFAALVGVTPATVTRWEQGGRVLTGHEEIGALLRVAEPEQQRELLELLGIEDVERFAADLLASADVVLVEVGGNGRGGGAPICLLVLPSYLAGGAVHVPPCWPTPACTSSRVPRNQPAGTS